MVFIHNNQVIDATLEPIMNKWKLKQVYGEVRCDKPKMCLFRNTAKAIQLLNKHVNNKDIIALHTDVDMDGVGTTYIAKTTLNYLGVLNTPIVINREKIHGIQQKHAEFFKQYKIGLIVITDSSSNDIDIIKQFECDVLVVDHHDIEHSDMAGKCNDGIHEYVIVNSTIENNNHEEDLKFFKTLNSEAFNDVDMYNGTQTMSCALAYYELMRIYFSCYNNVKAIENLKLYQWAGITLFTDVIDTITERNQWYLDNTLFTTELENTLSIIIKQLNKYKIRMDKSYIEYTFAPLVNKAIRANKGAEVIERVINNPNTVAELKQYTPLQDEMINKALNVQVKDPNTGLVSVSKRTFGSEYVIFDTSSYDVHPNYNGVIASRIQGDLGKNAAVYSIKENGECQGSFRGKHKEINYRKFFLDSIPGIYAQGHPGAFGFKAKKQELEEIMQKIHTIEPVEQSKPLFSVGDIPPEDRGVYHITDMDAFKKMGYLVKIAIGNSKVISTDEVFIRVRSEDVKLKETRGKLFIYETFDIECKAFSPMVGKYFDIYMEYSNEICAYLRSVKA